MIPERLIANGITINSITTIRQVKVTITSADKSNAWLAETKYEGPIPANGSYSLALYASFHSMKKKGLD